MSNSQIPSPGHSSPLRRAFTKIAAAAVILGCFTASLHAVVDTDLTKKVWKLKYGVSDTDIANGTWLAADNDGDGVTNGEEIWAGTNPFSPSTTIKVTGIVLSGGNAQLTFPTLVGKRYQVESSPSLTAPVWTAQPQPTPTVANGTGNPVMISVPHSTSPFYQVKVFEDDIDGDGLSAWVENETGRDPNSATTSGVSDSTYVTSQIDLPSVVTIKAVTPFASEDGPIAGSFVVTRGQNKLLPIDVNLNVTGTATAGADYSALPAMLHFNAGSDVPTTSLSVNPIPNGTAPEGSESVTTALVAPAPGNPSFTLDAAYNTATVIINDSTVASGTGLLALYYDTSSGTAADAINFGQAATGTFTYVRAAVASPYPGSTILVPTTLAGISMGNLVKLSFNGGNLNGSAFDDQVYTVTAVSAGVSFTVGISGAALPASYSGQTCSFSIQSFPHPAAIQRVDAVVNNDWAYGTPNGVTITETGGVQTNRPDNYSDTFETYLHPTTAGNYTFQLDADDKARVLVDLNLNGTFDLPGEQILEHGWDTSSTGSPEDGVADNETLGTFKVSSAYALAVPAGAATRYKMRVEHVETTGDARCRLQWKLDNGSFGNIATANQFTHTRALTNYTVTSAVATINTAVAHGLTAGVSTVTLYFSNGTLFTPPANYSGTYTVATVVDADTFTVSVPGATDQGGTGAVGFMVDTTSATTGVFNLTYANTTFTNPPGRVGVDAAVTTGNNGIWGSGTPDVALINPDTFSIRWTGQVQPQFSEDYTFVVQADDGCTLTINGQAQTMKMSPSANTGVGSYTYDSTTGNTLVTYPTAIVRAGSFIVGETVRMDPSSSNLHHAPTTSPTYSYDSGTGVMTVNYTNLTNATPGGFVAGDSLELDPTSGNLTTLSNLPYTILASPAPTSTTFAVTVGIGAFATGAGNININDSRNAVITSIHATGTGTYSYDTGTGDAVITYTSLGVPAGTFVDGQKIALDPTSGNLNLAANASNPSAFYVISAVTATTFTATFGAGFGTGVGDMFIVAPSNGSIAVGATTAFAVNIGAGKYANNSTGSINVDLVNKSLKDWSSNGNERFVRIPMLGGVRYDIQLDYYENNSYARAQLSWYSPSQPKQIIPSERLYPSNGSLAPTAYVAPTEATALVGGAFSHAIAGSNGGTVSVSGNPGWLTYGAGVLSGTPTGGSAGDYQIVITVTNAAGTSTSVLNLHVDENTGSVVREYWNGVAGTTVASIPTSTAPTGTANLTTLEGPTDFGNDYGARVRGYITAPTTGNYYFWVAASNAAELWISNDDDPINAFKRAWVTTGNATPQTWTGEANQKSQWLALEQGQKYYFEILHKAGVGAGDNVAVGWAKPGQATTAPSQVVPGFVLSPYVAPAPNSTPGTLYVATMLAEAGAVSNGVGVATLRLSEDENVVYVKFDIPGFLAAPYNGLTGPMTDWHIHNDPYLTHASAIMYDPTAPPANSGLEPDGSHKWTIPGTVGTLSKANVVELIKQGKSYINIHTSAYLNGEIRGNFTLSNGTRTFTAPPAPLSWTDDHATDAGASRFLTQATFGPNTTDIAALKAMASYEAWIDDQFSKSATQHLPEVLAREIADVFGPFDVKVTFNTWWKNSMTADDQLRQRVAFALSEIHVVSGQGPLEDNSRAISDFYDTLLDHAFGNFGNILKNTTLTPAMGRYLDMLGNDKPDQSVGRIPNENYAREIKQLFSIGLYRMWPDGTLMLNQDDSPIDTYTQREIVGLSHVFTGWYYGYDGDFRTAMNATANWTRPMREVPARHYTGPKRVLNNEVLPGLTSVGGQPLDPFATHVSTTYNDPTYQALPALENDAVHDMLFNHPNTGPFICRQLIQRMVTSNPSRDYLYRVVQKFNDHGDVAQYGAERRGSMKAVIKAILLDYEARSTAEITKPAYGKQREPIMRVANAARAFRPASVGGTYTQTGSNTIEINTGSTPHLVQAGNNVFLECTDATTPTAQPALTSGTYTVLSSPAPTTSAPYKYYINAPGWLLCTYSQTGGSNVMTITTVGNATHSLPGVNANQPSLPSANWGQAYFDFTSGTANGLVSFDQTVLTVASSSSYDTPSTVGNTDTVGTTAGSTNGTHSFTITAPDTTARSGNVMISRFPGSYSCTGAGGVITIDTAYGGIGTFGAMADHGLSVGNTVFLNFTGSRDTTSFVETSTENDIAYTIVSVPDPNTFTVTARSQPNAAMNSDNQVVIFPLLPQPMTRNGTVNTRQGTYTMENTDLELSQTPLNSPTVFNYFLPDYKYAGTLASQGITTPEFQLTAETSAVRQANYLYNGVFGSGNTNGTSSFNNGNHALVMDLGQWMGLAVNTAGTVGAVLGAGPQTGQAWTSNANLPTLIDRLNTLLLAGQLDTNGKAVIQKFLFRTISSVTTAPSGGCTFNSTAHGLNAGDTITISGITGGTYANADTDGNGTFLVSATGLTANAFKLRNTANTLDLNCLATPGTLTGAHYSPIVYNNSGPSTTEIRDRLRAILHFILTSPDYTIQR